MSVGQIQGICDPTNTHNIWIASYLGTNTQALLRKTLPYAWTAVILGLTLHVVWVIYINNMTASSIRIGIDVGGTFTHAVAIDALSLEVLGHAKVPTTHESKSGVAQGVIESLNSVFKDLNISPDKVSFIAHSTTQATNALLEGDVAVVGILGMGGGATAWLAAQQTKLGKISLGQGYFLKTCHYFIDTSKGINKETIIRAFASLKDAGAEAYVIK